MKVLPLNCPFILAKQTGGTNASEFVCEKGQIHIVGLCNLVLPGPFLSDYFVLAAYKIQVNTTFLGVIQYSQSYEDPQTFHGV